MRDPNYKDLVYLRATIKRNEQSINLLKNKFEAERVKVRQLEIVEERYLKLRLRYAQLEKQAEINKAVVGALIKQNKVIFRPFFNAETNQFKREDDCITTIWTAISDFENAFVFQKLFEMHLCDCIIDKLFGLHKLDYISDKRLEQMFDETRDFVVKVVFNEVRNDRLHLREFKQELYNYVDTQVKSLGKSAVAKPIEEMELD